MLFTDVSAERAIKAFSKVGFKTVTKGKHFGMSDGTHRITIPNHKRLNPYTHSIPIKAIKEIKIIKSIFLKIISDLSFHSIISVKTVNNSLTKNTKLL